MDPKWTRVNYVVNLVTVQIIFGIDLMVTSMVLFDQASNSEYEVQNYRPYNGSYTCHYYWPIVVPSFRKNTSCHYNGSDLSIKHVWLSKFSNPYLSSHFVLNNLLHVPVIIKTYCQNLQKISNAVFFESHPNISLCC